MKSTALFFILMPCLCLLMCACKHAQTNPGPIQLGAIYNRSGNQAELDIPSSQGAQLAVQQINSAGGVLGRPLELILKDGESTTQEVADKVKEILQQAPGAPAIFGLSDSDLALSAGIETKRANKVFLTSGATSPELPGQIPGYMYLACFGDNVQAAAAAEWAYTELNARTVVVLYDSVETYTLLLHRYFMDRFESLGGKVLALEPFNPDIPNQHIPNLPKADFIYLAAEVAPEAIPMIKKLREHGINSPIVGGDGYDAEDSWQNNPDIEYVFFTTHAYLGADSPNEKVRQFRDDYSEFYGGNMPDAFAALGYDAVHLLAAAIVKAGNINPDSVRLALGALQNIPGVTGTISFVAGKQIPTKSVTIMEVKAGKVKFLKEITPVVIPDP